MAREHTLIEFDTADDGGGHQNFLKTKETTTLLNQDNNGEALPEQIMKLKDTGPPPFLKKTFEMVDDPTTDSIISWSHSKKSFIIWDHDKFSTHLLPQRFKHSNFSSFIRQLNYYRFRKIDPDRWEYANDYFQEGKKHLLREINRRTTNQTQNMQKQAEPKQQQQQQQSCINQTSLRMESEVNILRKDRIALRQEVLNMKQQQDKAEKQLEIVQERVVRMELKQQQLLAFMSKVYRGPVFVKHLQHLVQKQKTGRGEMCKKRNFEQMLSTANAECVQQQVWNMMEPDVATVFSSDEPVKDQKIGDVKSLLMKNEGMIHSEDQTKAYIQELEELIPKV